MAEKGWIRRHIIMSAISAFMGLTAVAIWTSQPLRAFLVSIPGHMAVFFRWFGKPVETWRWYYWLLTLVFAGVVLRSIIALMNDRAGEPDWRVYTEDSFFGCL